MECTPKIKFFLWLIMWGRIPCAVHLAQRNIIPNPFCLFCPNVEEDMNHLFRDCPRAAEFWGEAQKANHPQNGTSLPFREWLEYNINQKEPPTHTSAILSSVFVYFLWVFGLGETHGCLKRSLRLLFRCGRKPFG